MGNALIAFLIGLGVATWIYNKLMKTTGNNTKNSLVASVIIGLVIWLIGTYALSILDVSLG